MAGLKGSAAIVGFVELAPRPKIEEPPQFSIERWAELARLALEDAGLTADQVDGLVTGQLRETAYFAPSTIAEYLGLEVSYGELVDLGGATAAGMIWRAAAAVELGLCDVVLVVTPGMKFVPESEFFEPPNEWWLGASSGRYGSPQAEFEIPYGNLGQNAPYAQIARRYAHEYGYEPEAMAKIAVDQRTNACATPGAVFHGRPITINDVLTSPMIADPLHLLEIVMPCDGGAAVVIANEKIAKQGQHRPVWISGFGEHLTHKTPTYAKDLLTSPLAVAAEKAFQMAGVERKHIDIASVYDCYTITVLMSLEDAGFCEKGQGAKFIRDHDLTFAGDFPLNTAGGQLSYGQAAMAGGMHHVCDGVRQLSGRAGDAQVASADLAFVTGNGGIMSEQVALILRGE